MLGILSAIAAALLGMCRVTAQLINDTPFNMTLDRRDTASPIMGGQNFPDPSLIRVRDGWHAFATNAHINDQLIHVQMGYTPDFETWTYRSGVDAMPVLAPWVEKGSSPRVWAPDVIQLGDGSFLMYYTAAWNEKSNIHCVSYATSTHVDGPYVDKLSAPWICPSAIGGAIDPAGYQNADGTRWVVYKVDGNAIGHGGACGNTVPPIVPTPIMLQQVSEGDGHTEIGSPIQLITNGPADGPYVEAPSLTYLGGKYVLFFSSNCFQTDAYDVSYATASTVKGPYTKYGPLFVTGTDGLRAPGGLDIAVNGNHAIWHGNYGAGRAAYTAILSHSNNVVKASAMS